jgi:hypothetical protein
MPVLIVRRPSAGCSGAGVKKVRSGDTARCRHRSRFRFIPLLLVAAVQNVITRVVFLLHVLKVSKNQKRGM